MTAQKKSHPLRHAKLFLVALLASLITITFAATNLKDTLKPQVKGATITNESYWFKLHRKSNKEDLYYGIPGVAEQSTLIKIFDVKSGIPGKRPTPLPNLLGHEYWLITKKEDSSTNPETAPYFLTLNIPTSDTAPFGPENYNECNGQCNWEKPGFFGLHGVGGDPSRLDANNQGSSGCIRHRDEDIVYLYNLLSQDKFPVRYYIEDN